MHSVVHSAAVNRYLTTRMPVLWWWVGMCGTGIGVVDGYSILFIKNVVILLKILCFVFHLSRKSEDCINLSEVLRCPVVLPICP